MAELYIRDDLLGWAGNEPFAKAKTQNGQQFRNKEGRRTLRFEYLGKSYFLKYHGGIGWKEIFKNLIQLRLPVLGASNEYRAAKWLNKMGVETLTPAAYGSRGCNPATQQSFIVTDDLINTTSLEDYCRHWPMQKPAFNVKRALINKVAQAAKTMHESGINHRDFYICHFLVENGFEEKINRGLFFNCYLIDLHRCQIRKRVPARWQEKDLAGLLYSTMDVGLSLRDYFRFVRAYSGKPIKKSLCEDNWSKVVQTAEKLYQKDFGKLPELRLLQNKIYP